MFSACLSLQVGVQKVALSVDGAVDLVVLVVKEEDLKPR